MSRIKYLSILIILLFLSTIFLPFAFAAEDQDKEEIEFKLRKEEVIFIPYRELNKLLNNNKNLVFMSYKELQDLINEKSQIRPLAPVNYVIKDLSLVGEAYNDHVSFNATYQIEILNKDWTYLPVLSKEVGLKTAEFDGNPAPISIDGNNFRILSDKLGKHELKLKFDVKLKESGNTKSFNFNMPTLPITRLTVIVPETPVKLNIQNSSGLRAEEKGGKTITYANIIGQGYLSVDWKSNLIKMPTAKIKTPEETEKIYKKPSIVRADVNTLISVDKGILQGYSTYNCQIFHKPIEKLTLELPDDKDLTIISVTSPGDIVKKGPPKISDVDGKKILTVYFNSKIKDNAIFNITFEKTFENKKVSIDVPNIHLIGKEIDKVTGYIAIQSIASLEIKEKSLNNISVVDITDLPYDLTSLSQHPILLSYGFIKNAYDLKLEIIPHTDAEVQLAMIDKAQVTSTMSFNGTLVTKADYIIRNMSSPMFKFILPQKAELPDTYINGKKVIVTKEPENENDKTVYSINIKNFQNNSPFTISIMYKQDYKFNMLTKRLNRYPITAPKIKDIHILTLYWTVNLPDQHKYWFNTILNRGYIDYSSSIKWNYNAYDRNDITGKDYDYNARISSQIAQNIAPSSPLPLDEGFGGEDSGRVAGIIGAQNVMPPTDGTITNTFSDYLLDENAPKITVWAIMSYFNLLISILMLIAGWKLTKQFYSLAKVPDNNAARAKFVIPVIIVVYIAYRLFGFGTIVTPLIASIVAFIAYYNYQKFKNKQTTENN